MSKKNQQENDEVKRKLVEVLKGQKTLSKTADILEELGLVNSRDHRKLIRQLAKESAEIKTEKVNQQNRYWYAGLPKPPMPTKTEPKAKKAKATKVKVKAKKAKPAETEEAPAPTETAPTQEKPASKMNELLTKPKKEPRAIQAGELIVNPWKLKSGEPDPSNPWRPMP